MNYTNFTTDKPDAYEQSSTSTFGSGRDIAYLVFSILQFAITIFTLILVHHIIRKKDKKDEKERLEKEQRDKIADIIKDEYNKIVEDGINENLRKCKEKFEAMVMFYGNAWETRALGRNYKITGLDVLRYQLLNPNTFKHEPLRKLQKDLDAVLRLFRSLRIKLPPKLDCPINIKEELGPLITEVGEIARSFVSARKRYTIANVLKYFGNVREVGSIRNEEKKDVDDARKIRRILPHVKSLKFGGPFYEENSQVSYHDEDFSFNILATPRSQLAGNLQVSYHEIDFTFDILATPGSQEQLSIISDLRHIKHELCMNTGKRIEAEVLRHFADKIDAIWRRKLEDLPIPDWGKEEHLRANILHAVYVFIFKVAEGWDMIHDEEFKRLVEEMRGITYVNDCDMHKWKSERAIQDIQQSMNRLTSGSLACLCEQKSIVDILERVNIEINDGIGQAFRNQSN